MPETPGCSTQWPLQDSSPYERAINALGHSVGDRQWEGGDEGSIHSGAKPCVGQAIGLSSRCSPVWW